MAYSCLFLESIVTCARSVTRFYQALLGKFYGVCNDVAYIVIDTSIVLYLHQTGNTSIISISHDC